MDSDDSRPGSSVSGSSDSEQAPSASGKEQEDDQSDGSGSGASRSPSPSSNAGGDAGGDEQEDGAGDGVMAGTEGNRDRSRSNTSGSLTYDGGKHDSLSSPSKPFDAASQSNSPSYRSADNSRHSQPKSPASSPNQRSRSGSLSDGVKSPSPEPGGREFRSLSKDSNRSDNSGAGDERHRRGSVGGGSLNRQQRSLSRTSSTSNLSEKLKGEEISDCEIESDREDPCDEPAAGTAEVGGEAGEADGERAAGAKKDGNRALDMSHEDLSDVSLESDNEPDQEDEEEEDDDERDSEMESEKGHNTRGGRGGGDNDDVRPGNVERLEDDEEEDGEDDERSLPATGASHGREFRREGSESREPIMQERPKITDLRQKLEEKKIQLRSMEAEKHAMNGGAEGGGAGGTNGNTGAPLLEGGNMMDKKIDEDALDFEAEEGECNDVPKEGAGEKRTDGSASLEKGKKDEGSKKRETGGSDAELEDGEELEEGEVSDEDEKRPEETEPKPVCRFYTRGQCTWGMSCRFLHPGVTDKGNYTMFDMVRPVSITHPPPAPAGYGGHGGPIFAADYRHERPAALHHLATAHHPAVVAPYPAAVGLPVAGGRPVEPVVGESAWERGLRTAKEMMRKANKRKEQDIDFDDKKMNLSLSQEELEKDNYYTRDRASPPNLSPSYAGRPPLAAVPPVFDYPPASSKFPRAGGPGIGPAGPPTFEEDAFGRTHRYRELPSHRMPQYEDEDLTKRRHPRATREVILQRADEWNDPWMRSKSPGRDGKRVGRRAGERRSYSNSSSYSSSSSSSRSGSSSDSSRSPSPPNVAPARRKRYDSHRSKESHGERHAAATHVRKVIRTRSPSVSPRRVGGRKGSPGVGNNGRMKRIDKRVTSPMMVEKQRVVEKVVTAKRKKSPPSSMHKTAGDKRRRHSSSSGSGSSDSSDSGSESSYSSSSSSSSPEAKVSRGAKGVRVAEKGGAKVSGMGKKGDSKKGMDGKSGSAQVIPPSSAAMEKANANTSKKSSRREELLKQLRAVEEAIARKRTKVP